MAALETPVADGTDIGELIGGKLYGRNLLNDTTGADAMGVVGADPAANTILGRLKAIATAVAASEAAIVAAVGDIPGGGGGDATAANQTTLIGHVDGIEAQLTAIAGYVDGLEGLFGTNNTALAAISGYLDTVETLIGTTNTTLTTIDGRVDGLEALIGTTNTTLTTIGGYLDTVETLLTAMSGKLPASLGAKTAAASLSVTPASDATFVLAASEAIIGAIAGTADLVDVTLSLDTSAYAAGDVLADTQAIANAVRINGGKAVLQSIQVIDEDDQGAAFDLVFLSANSSLGTENAAPSITDAGARDVLGFVPIAAGDFIDLGGVRVATVRNVGLFLEAGAASTTLYVGAISRGTGTYTASGIKLRLGMVWS